MLLDPISPLGPHRDSVQAECPVSIPTKDWDEQVPPWCALREVLPTRTQGHPALKDIPLCSAGLDISASTEPPAISLTRCGGLIAVLPDLISPLRPYWDTPCTGNVLSPSPQRPGMGRGPGQSWGAPSAHPSSAQAAILAPLTALIPPGMEPSCSFCLRMSWDWLSRSESGAGNATVGSIPTWVIHCWTRCSFGSLPTRIFCESVKIISNFPLQTHIPFPSSPIAHLHLV